jgi:hypothetical protein
MISRDKIIEEIQNVPDELLDQLYQVIRNFEIKKERDSEPSVMARLRQIRISASPDFSTKASLYDLEQNNAE